MGVDFSSAWKGSLDVRLYTKGESIASIMHSSPKNSGSRRFEAFVLYTFWSLVELHVVWLLKLVQVKAGSLTANAIPCWDLVEEVSPDSHRSEETSASRLGLSFLIPFLLAYRLLEALQENIKGKFLSPDTNFMFCVVDVLAGVFFAWLILRPFVVLRWRGRQKVGSCWWELLLNFGVDDIILHRLVIHSLIHMYRIRDCDRSGISTAPWRHR